MAIDKLLCFAHRGASGHEPENTLLSVEKAISLGADWVEVDVYAVEGELVVIHDERLERTTNGTGYVTERSLGYLRSLDAGKGQRIPTLREVFELVGRRAGINVELKGRKTAHLTVSLIDEYIKERVWDADKFIISSFNKRELTKVKRIAPNLNLGVIISERYHQYTQFVRKHVIYSVHPHISLVNRRFVEHAHERGLKVFVFTVNDPRDIIRMEAMGIDGIFTDFPKRLTTSISFT
jgi:glycerophosphoryl diester phosphodiesterase